MTMPRWARVCIAMSAGLTLTALGGLAEPAQATTVDPGKSDGLAAMPSNQLVFAGYPWTVKSSTSPVGPGPNVFDARGPYVDSSGAMRLRIVKTTSGWESSEVILNPALGYGTYEWTLHGPVSTLDPNVVLGLFTYDNSNTSPTHREIDFEASRWGNALNPTNAQYVVQPYYTSGNLRRITIPKGVRTTVSLTWTPGTVTFSGETVRANGKTVALPSWTNRSPSVPDTSTQQVHMNLVQLGGFPPSNGRPVTVTVTGFQFSPAPLNVAATATPRTEGNGPAGPAGALGSGGVRGHNRAGSAQTHMARPWSATNVRGADRVHRTRSENRQ
jgi:hypothetical protein